MYYKYLYCLKFKLNYYKFYYFQANQDQVHGHVEIRTNFREGDFTETFEVYPKFIHLALII